MTSPMNTDTSWAAKVPRFLLRIVGAVVLLALGLFCLFGFLASFEPGNGLEWKVVYGALACGCLVGAALALMGRDKKRATRRGSMNQ